ncbi:MAG TPA: hypothetical protein VMQ73_20205 [Methylomirabilota bacterium]|nr:hypothetical protein [Methylomirabilota bacterium]
MTLWSAVTAGWRRCLRQLAAAAQYIEKRRREAAATRGSLRASHDDFMPLPW